MFKESSFGDFLKKKSEKLPSKEEQELGLIDRSIAHFKTQASDDNDKSKYIRAHFIEQLQKQKDKLLEKMKGNKNHDNMSLS